MRLLRRPARSLCRAAAPALAALVLFGGCDVLSDRLHDDSAVPALDFPGVLNARADSILSVDVQPRVAVFDVGASMPTPCYTYAGAATKVVGTRVTVEMRIRSTQNVCIQILGGMRVQGLAVRVPAPGRYTFAFWRGDGRPPLERVVDVP